jgi:hypothetical protein
MAAEVALAVIARQAVKQVHHTNFGGFLLLLVERDRCDTRHLPITSGASPATIGNQEVQNTFNQ